MPPIDSNYRHIPETPGRTEHGTGLNEVLLRASLFVLFFLPPLVIIPGRFNGQWLFVNYREPKLVAVQVLAWLFLTIFWWGIWKDHARLEHIEGIFKDGFTLLFGIFLGYLCLTAIKAQVMSASLYELAQYFTLMNLYLALVTLWHEEKLLKLSLLGITASFVLVTAIGLYQLVRPIPFLIPLPGPPNPSTIGYKNPAALAVAGQAFLLLALTAMALDGRRSWLPALGIPIFLAESAYIATLQSRTTYFAFSVSMIFMVAMIIYHLYRTGRRGAVRTMLPVIILSFIILGATIWRYPPAHQRFDKMTVYFKSPSRLLSSDRGTYLRNSLYMARKNLLGVGIGNWGFAYPLYRHFQPKLFFTQDVQVRRAHGDYAQMLGETGWPGLLLFLFLLGWTFLRGLRAALAASSPWPTFTFAQYLTFLLLMLFDYCIEMPYHKFAFFAVVAMVNASFLFHGPGLRASTKTPHLKGLGE